MGFLDRLLGRTPPTDQQQPVGWGDASNLRSAATPARPQGSEEERALARYRYLLRTAPPEQLEALHAEAFAKLTPEQRQQLLRELATASPGEAGTSAEPADLARAATRAEMRQPGTMERALGGRGGGMGMGGMIAGTLLASVAGAFIGTAIADAFFDMDDGFDGAADAGGDELAADQGVDDPGADLGGGDFGGDLGGDF